MPDKGSVDDILLTYVEAMKKFSTSANVFLQHVSLLTQARNEYQKAVAASAEIRNALNAGDENLRLLMAQLEKAVSTPFVEAMLDKKEVESAPEVVKADSGKTNGAKPAVMRAFP